MHEGSCTFSSVSQNWPTAEPSFQETGLHCPADHDKREVRRLVDLVVRTVQAFGLHRGVLHVEGKCTSRGPRIVEVNARLDGGRIWQYVREAWGVDLVEGLVPACLGLPPPVKGSRRPQRAVVNAIVHAPASGRLAALPFGAVEPRDGAEVIVDVNAKVGDTVEGPEKIFASVLGEASVVAKDLRTARRLAAELLPDPRWFSGPGSRARSRGAVLAAVARPETPRRRRGVLVVFRPPPTSVGRGPTIPVRRQIQGDLCARVQVASTALA